MQSIMMTYASDEGSTTVGAVTTLADEAIYIGDVAEKFHDFLDAAGFDVVDVLIVLPNGDTVSAQD